VVDRFTVGLFLAIKKRKEILPFVTKCIKLEDVILNEISQIQKDKCHIISLTCGI
jgi:hypothetical protein